MKYSYEISAQREETTIDMVYFSGVDHFGSSDSFEEAEEKLSEYLDKYYQGYEITPMYRGKKAVKKKHNSLFQNNDPPRALEGLRVLRVPKKRAAHLSPLLQEGSNGQCPKILNRQVAPKGGDGKGLIC